jgi:hypothetical protein
MTTKGKNLQGWGSTAARMAGQNSRGGEAPPPAPPPAPPYLGVPHAAQQPRAVLGLRRPARRVRVRRHRAKTMQGGGGLPARHHFRVAGKRAGGRIGAQEHKRFRFGGGFEGQTCTGTRRRARWPRDEGAARRQGGRRSTIGTSPSVCIDLLGVDQLGLGRAAQGATKQGACVVGALRCTGGQGQRGAGGERGGGARAQTG